MYINGKKIISEEEIQNVFNVSQSTVRRWYSEGLKHFQVKKKNYVFEDEFENYLRGISKWVVLIWKSIAK